MKTLKTLSITATLTVLSGCTANSNYLMCTTGNVDTNLKSYSAEHEYNNMLVYSSGEFSSLMCNELKQRGISCQSYDQVFSPLEDYTTEQIGDRIRAGGFDSVMFINDVSSKAQSHDLGSISHINTFNAGGSVTTTNITSISRSDRFGVVIYDVQTDKKVYLANTATSGAGTACVNDYVYLRSAAEAITKDILM
ncbi:hypothetical protein ACBZ91_06700 [Vibrio natriegens]|uniref:hypothetical protein n=1 Tax=Vibrio natriegens TaxID=691 RepID=UPI00355833B1